MLGLIKKEGKILSPTREQTLYKTEYPIKSVPFKAVAAVLLNMVNVAVPEPGTQVKVMLFVALLLPPWIVNPITEVTVILVFVQVMA